MITALIKAIYDRLVADGLLAALIADYGGSPAVFSGDHIPEDADLPYCWIQPIDDGFDVGLKNARGWDISLSVSVFFPLDGSPLRVDAAALRIVEILNRSPIAVSGYQNIVITTSAPIPTAPEDSAIGRAVRVRVIIMEE